MKYQVKLSSIENCPPAGRSLVEIDAYHLVREPLCSDLNFLTIHERVPSQYPEGDPMECRSYALSMFDCVENLRKHFDCIFGRNPKRRKKFGDKIAMANLTTSDGVYTTPEVTGHFPFWAKINFQPTNSFRIVDHL